MMNSNQSSRSAWISCFSYYISKLSWGVKKQGPKSKTPRNGVTGTNHKNIKMGCWKNRVERSHGLDPYSNDPEARWNMDLDQILYSRLNMSWGFLLRLDILSSARTIGRNGESSYHEFGSNSRIIFRDQHLEIPKHVKAELVDLSKKQITKMTTDIFDAMRVFVEDENRNNQLVFEILEKEIIEKINRLNTTLENSKERKTFPHEILIAGGPDVSTVFRPNEPLIQTGSRLNPKSNNVLAPESMIIGNQNYAYDKHTVHQYPASQNSENNKISEPGDLVGHQKRLNRTHSSTNVYTANMNRASIIPPKLTNYAHQENQVYKINKNGAYEFVDNAVYLINQSKADVHSLMESHFHIYHGKIHRDLQNELKSTFRKLYLAFVTTISSRSMTQELLLYNPSEVIIEYQKACQHLETEVSNLISKLTKDLLTLQTPSESDEHILALCEALVDECYSVIDSVISCIKVFYQKLIYRALLLFTIKKDYISKQLIQFFQEKEELASRAVEKYVLENIDLFNRIFDH